MIIDYKLKPEDLKGLLDNFFNAAGATLLQLNSDWDPAKGSPVFTRKGKYTTQGWTEWTQGFMYGCQILQFDATGDEQFLEMGRNNTMDLMAPHVSHNGVHDHGFNNVSTYGNLRRLGLEGKTSNDSLMPAYEMALKVSGAVQASRWTVIEDGTGYIHSFNGAHSLFSDTVRSCRSLTLSHLLGHVLMSEGDKSHNLLDRAIEHMTNTSKFNVWYGDGRDLYDTFPGRVVHESIFNVKDGAWRCPSTQQGYSPFSTWTRGLSWVVSGYPEELEFFRDCVKDEELEKHGGRKKVEAMMLRTAKATCDFFIAHTCTDGIPYWDTGAPGLAKLENLYDVAAVPDNPNEPFDSSAAAICAQGLLRLGDYLGKETEEGKKYWQAGLSVSRTLLQEPWFSADPNHHGLLLGSIYHWPRKWDYVPEGSVVPHGESAMWGDYHLMELAVYLLRVTKNQPVNTFYGPVE